MSRRRLARLASRGWCSGGADHAFDDLWAYDGTAWTESDASVRPPARFDTQMVYDAARQRVLLFGGETDSGEALNDLWSWDGSQWTELHSTGDAPPGRGFFVRS